MKLFLIISSLSFMELVLLYEKLPQSFDYQSQPKLDSEFTKDRFTNQVVVTTGRRLWRHRFRIPIRWHKSGFHRSKRNQRTINSKRTEKQGAKFYKCT